MARQRYTEHKQMFESPDLNLYIKRGKEEPKPLTTILSRKITAVAMRDYKNDLQVTFQSMYEAHEREKQNTFWISNVLTRLEKLEALLNAEKKQRRIPEKVKRRN